MGERRVYLDSSAIVKRYVEERGTETVDSIFKEAEAGAVELHFSAWNVGEVAAAFDKYERRGAINGKQTYAIFLNETARLNRFGTLAIVPLTLSLVSSSIKYIFTYDLYAADAIQLASSKESSCGKFLTADSRLREAAASEGVETPML